MSQNMFSLNESPHGHLTQFHKIVTKFPQILEIVTSNTKLAEDYFYLEPGECRQIGTVLNADIGAASCSS